MKFPMGTIGYFHGRFQPFHLGHLDVVKRVLDECELAVIGISNPFRLPPIIEDGFDQPAVDSLYIARSRQDNPWPYWARILMIRQGLVKAGLALERVLFIPNVSNTGLPVDEIRFPKMYTVVFICPKGEHNKAAAAKYERDGWRVVYVKESQGGIGAAVIRQRLRSGLEWESLVPTGTAEVIKLLGPDFLMEGATL